MNKLAIVFAACAGGLAVIMGAFGSHALSSVLSERHMHAYETAVQYQFYHAFAILLVCGLSHRLAPRLNNIALWCFIIGTCLFSGSLYLLTLLNATWLGPITPLGGLALIIGWLVFALAAVKGNNNE